MTGHLSRSCGPTAAMQVRPLQRPDRGVETQPLLTHFPCFPVSTGVCALNGKLYIVGGSDPYGQKGLKNCDVFDPVTKAWTSCAPLNIRKFVGELGREGEKRAIAELHQTKIYTKAKPV